MATLLHRPTSISGSRLFVNVQRALTVQLHVNCPQFSIEVSSKVIPCRSKFDHLLLKKNQVDTQFSAVYSNTRSRSRPIKCYSTFNGDGHDGCGLPGDDSKVIRVLPRRLLKRLEKQGISETEFLSKLNSMNTVENDILPDKNSGDSVNVSKEELKTLLQTMTNSPTKFISDMDSFPSDVEKYKHWASTESGKLVKPKVSPSTMSVVLFPGQGSQFVGMGKKLLDFPGVSNLYEEASSIFGYNLLELCLNGPKSELDRTVYCQPAVVVTSLAAIEKLREEHPQAVENCAAAAGFSVGEFAALVFSGVISFPDAMKLVKVRAEAMQRASEQVGSGMLTVFLAHDSNIKEAMKMAKEYCFTRCKIPEPICCMANYLFPECKVIAGHEEALEFIATNYKDFRILRTKRLPVSGAFHTQLMASAMSPLQKAMTGMKLGTPKITTYSNVTSSPYHGRTNVAHILSQQLVKPVKWEQIMHAVFKRPQGEDFPHTYEVGPGKQMGTLLKQVNLTAFKQYHSVEV